MNNITRHRPSIMSVVLILIVVYVAFKPPFHRDALEIIVRLVAIVCGSFIACEEWVDMKGEQDQDD